MDFGGVLEAETMDSVWERYQKSHFCSHSFFHRFGTRLGALLLLKTHQNPVLAHFGALGSEFSTSVASTFSQCFFEVLSGTPFSRKGFQREGAREGGVSLRSFHLPPLTLSPPAAQEPE